MTDPTPIAVTAHGFGWTAAGAWASFVALMGVIIRQVGPWKKQTSDAESKLRDGLMARVEKLEKALEHKDAIHAAERALDRHKIANLTQCFDAVMLMLEVSPERAGEMITRVKEMRAAQMTAEATEKATIHAAEIAARGPENA
jgi:hypothetical protein